MTPKIVHLNNRAARRRVRNAEVSANAQPVMAVILHAKRAVKRDGMVGPIKQVAFCEPNEANKCRAISELLHWAYEYSGSAESRETGIARILTPEASMLYAEMRRMEEADLMRIETWARLFQKLEQDGVTFSTEERSIEA
jgi:hypothetical protein